MRFLRLFILFLVAVFKGHPKYGMGAIIRDPRGRFVVLRNVRWVRPNNYPEYPKWQWVYDGIVLDLRDSGVAFSTGIFTMPEREIVPVPHLS